MATQCSYKSNGKSNDPATSCRRSSGADINRNLCCLTPWWIYGAIVVDTGIRPLWSSLYSWTAVVVGWWTDAVDKECVGEIGVWQSETWSFGNRVADSESTSPQVGALCHHWHVYAEEKGWMATVRSRGKRNCKLPVRESGNCYWFRTIQSDSVGFRVFRRGQSLLVRALIKDIDRMWFRSNQHRKTWPLV